MRVIKRGHTYELNHIGGKNKSIVAFVNKEPGHEQEGVTTQEIMRMLIDRTHYCHNCLPHRVNESIIWHMRQIIALHEARAIEQKVAKGEILPEHMWLGSDGHFDLSSKTSAHMLVDPLAELYLEPVPKLGEQKCNHRSGE